MHIFFPVSHRAGSAIDGHEASTDMDAGQIQIVRDPEDESEWQYLGNPQIAARTTLKDVVARFIQDCSGPDGAIDRDHGLAARKVRDALILAARQIDEALARSGS